jgi:hypothetical protein
LVKAGAIVWKASVVPVGRSFDRLATVPSDLSKSCFIFSPGGILPPSGLLPLLPLPSLSKGCFTFFSPGLLGSTPSGLPPLGDDGGVACCLLASP